VRRSALVLALLLVACSQREPSPAVTAAIQRLDARRAAVVENCAVLADVGRGQAAAGKLTFNLKFILED
jgi:hypothetical protein